MKKILVLSMMLFSMSAAASGLDREEREEYVKCEKMAYIVNNWGITWADQDAWNETRELYRAEMSALQLNKAEKKIKSEKRKIDTKLNGVTRELPEYVPEEHNAYLIFAALLIDDKAREAYYNCF